MPTAIVATCTLAVVAFIALVVRGLRLGVVSWLPWVAVALSLSLVLGPWLLLAGGSPEAASLVYRGLHIPQGTIRFWDMTLVMQSIDCARVGVDVFAANNGCLKDPAIYGPGQLWLQYVPLRIFSASNADALGLLLAFASSLGLFWLVRNTRAAGQLVLVAAAVGAPWLLLLERGNIDAVVFLVAIAAVILTRRWPALWAWSIAAGLFWLMGTWKYYPFVLGLMLLPVLRLRRGWMVLVGYGAASLLFVIATWSNFQFSSQSNSNMTEVGDFVVLGRVPVVARMVGSVFPPVGLQFGDVLLVLLAVAAFAWGAVWAARLGGVRQTEATLAMGGAALYLASVLVGGFGWGYKAVFLLLCVPIVAFRRELSASQLSSALAVLILLGISSIVVWNTLLATLAGVVAASFALGAGLVQTLRPLRRRIRPLT